MVSSAEASAPTSEGERRCLSNPERLTLPRRQTEIGCSHRDDLAAIAGLMIVTGTARAGQQTSELMKNFRIDPLSMAKALASNAGLLWELTKRDFTGRYRGSFFGLAWSLFNPLLMLTIYTFVFSVAFKARWGQQGENDVNFAIVLFSGLIVHTLFAECLTRAPTLIIGNANYVKKVVFPLEILPLMTAGSAIGNFLVGLLVLVAFCLVTGTTMHASGMLLVVIIIPLLLMTVGLSWLLASLGVYLRDFAQVIGMVTTVSLFLAPIFYPLSALPVFFQNLLVFNPITLPVIQLRNALLWGEPIDWPAWSISLVIGLGVFYVGFAWFQKTRKGFADVL